jgi:hypothetical protein
VVIPPRNFADSTKDYKIQGTVNLRNVTINRIELTDTVSFRIGKVKQGKGLFKHKETTIQVIHTNPLIRSEGLSSIILKKKTSAWNKIIKPVLLGAAGIFIGTKL